MKKVLLALVVSLIVVSSALAAIDIRLKADIAFPVMKEFNAYHQDLSDYRNFLYPDDKKIENIMFGINLNMDVLFGIIPNLSVGPRIGYGFCFQSMVQNRNTGLNSGMLTKFDTYLVPLMMGLDVHVPVPKTNFLISAGGFAGYGFASLTQSQVLTILGYSRSGIVTYTSGGFTGDVYIGFIYKIAGVFSLGVNAGYRSAIIAGMKASEDSTDTVALNVVKGEELKTTGGTPITMDYSGLNAGLCLKFEF